MIWKDFSREFKKYGDHAFLGASQHSWYNYDDEKLMKVFLNRLATARGTKLHALAAQLIEMKVHLPDDRTTLSMYVNDGIDLGLRPEEKLFYSKFAYGTADTIDYRHGVLQISDLKTGKTKVSFLQLMIYAGLFFLAYPEVSLKNVKKIILRIYQNDEIYVKEPEIDDILPIMDKIERYSKILDNLEVEFDE